MFWQASDILACDAVSVDEWFPTFCRTVMPSFSRVKLSKKNSCFSWTTDPEDQSITILQNTGKHSLLTQQHSCTFWKTSVISMATVRTWNLTQLHLYHTTQCLIPHYSSLHCYFVSWGTVFRPYVRNWNTAAVSLGICCCLVLYSAVLLKV